MKFNPQIHRRRSIRLKGYDYSQAGAYFVTIVVHGRECLFGEVVEDEMRLNAAGEMIVVWWQKIPEKFPSAWLDTFVVMPNHFHGVIVIEAKNQIENAGQTHGSAPTDSHGSVGADPRVRPNASIGQMIQWFKTMTTNAYVRGVNDLGWTPFIGKLWQRNYYEHIVRNIEDHDRIRDYIESNPAQWVTDDENPLAGPASAGYP